MAYEQVQKPSSSFVPVKTKVSEFALSASRVQAKDDTAGEQEQIPKVSTPATDANWLMKHPLFKGNQFLQREVAPASESESLESEEETLQRQEEGNATGTPYSLPVQAKLTIGEPGDKYEQEADRVASQVVKQINSPEAASSSQGQSVQRREEPVEELQRQPSISDLQRTPLPLEVQREAMPAEEELQAKSILQSREAIAGGEASTDLDTAINRARGGGQSLDAGLQQSMGQAMGADFSGVKVHTDAQSDQLNQSIQAKAFTTGQDVFFRQGEYNPGSRGGQELIAHELTHVVQQGTTREPGKRHRIGEEKIQRVREDEFNDDPQKFNQENVVSVDFDGGMARRYTSTGDWKKVIEEINLHTMMEASATNWFTLEEVKTTSWSFSKQDKVYIVTPAIEKYIEEILRSRDSETEEVSKKLVNEYGNEVKNILGKGNEQKSYITAGYYPYKSGKPVLDHPTTIGNVKIDLQSVPESGLVVFTGGMNGCGIIAEEETAEGPAASQGVRLWHFQNCSSWPTEYESMAERGQVITSPEQYWREDVIDEAMKTSKGTGFPVATNMVIIYPNGRREVFGQVYLQTGTTVEKRSYKSLYRTGTGISPVG